MNTHKTIPMPLSMFSECWDIDLISPNNKNDILVVFDNNTICSVLQDDKEIFCNTQNQNIYNN